jgi:hypothetical protein
VVAFCSSDIQSIAISPNMGGCGQSHSRDGARVWRLECEQCSATVLGHSRPKVWKWLDRDRGYQRGQLDTWPGWSATLSDLPLSHDEQLDRDRVKRTGQSQMEQLTALSMAKTMGIEIPGALASMLGGAAALAELQEAPQVICPEGHANRPGARFCDLCGTSMQVPEGGAGNGQQAEAAQADAA